MNSKYNKPNYFTKPGLSIGMYRYYCDRINQFYKKFNIEDDISFQFYMSLNSDDKKEKYLNNIITNKRNNKIDSILS